MPTSRYVTIERGEVYREKSELWVRMKPMDLNSVILAELVEGSVPSLLKSGKTELILRQGRDSRHLLS